MITANSHKEVQCWKCHCSYVLPHALYVAAKASSKISFWCPYGHSAHYSDDETEEDKLRRERDRLKQKLAEMEDSNNYWVKRHDEAAKELKKERAAMKKVKTRVAGGVCVCCNRTFQNMASHMKTKHPEFKAEAA